MSDECTHIKVYAKYGGDFAPISCPYCAAELNNRENAQILRTVNDAINDAGIHCAITFAEAIRQIAQDRDKFRDQFQREDKQLLRVCVNFRIKELNEAVDMCLRRGMGSHLRHLNLTGQEAEAELRWLHRLRDKLL